MLGDFFRLKSIKNSNQHDQTSKFYTFETLVQALASRNFKDIVNSLALLREFLDHLALVWIRGVIDNLLCTHILQQFCLVIRGNYGTGVFGKLGGVSEISKIFFLEGTRAYFWSKKVHWTGFLYQNLVASNCNLIPKKTIPRNHCSTSERGSFLPIKNFRDMNKTYLWSYGILPECSIFQRLESALGCCGC